MSARITLATAVRVLAQLRRDRRTLALVFVVPALLLILLKYVLDGQPESFERIGTPLIGLFPFVVMFLTTSIAMLRERTGGTLERLMSMPLSKLDLLLGYGIAFAGVAAIQAIADGESRLGDKGRILVRPSGTEPVVRVMAEGEDDALITSVVADIAKAIETRAG